MVATNGTQGTNTRIKVINNQSKYYADLAAASASAAATSATNAQGSAADALNYKDSTYGYMERAETAAEAVADVTADLENIDAVAADLTNIDAVASDLSNIDTVAGNATNINAVNSNKTNIDTVAGNATNINAVAGNATNINAVNSNKTNIDTVATNISDVSNVANNISAITAVNSNETNINAVNTNATNINAVAGDLANINAVASDLTNIDSASSYATNANVWAEGTDVQVQALGGVHSSKGWAEVSSSGQVQANWDESDTTSKAYIQNKPTIPDAQIQSDWNQSDNTQKDYIKNKPTIPTVPTTLSSFTDDLGSSPTHTHSQYEDIAKAMSALSASGTLALSDNSTYKLSATGTVTFTLPTITDTTKFHQILVQLYMSSAQTINLGTTYYFTGEAPDMSEAGYYTIIFEYDNIRGGWVAGAMKKASA